MAHPPKQKAVQPPVSPSRVPPSETTLVRRGTVDAFMGFSVMPVADNCALCTGPEFSLCEVNNRPMSKKRLKQFVLAVGGDLSDATVTPNNLHRYEPENAIVVVISNKYVDETSLVPNPTPRQSFPRIRFKNQEEFGDATAMVINGHGRIVFVREYLCRDAVAEYTRIDKALKASGITTKTLPSKQVEVMTSRRIELIDILREHSNWLVAVYDLDKIESSKHSAQIKMNLARNIPIYQVPDTDDESLELILGLISERPRKRWVDEIKAHQASPIVASGPQRLPMILRNTAFMVELVHLYPYSRHWSETIKISLFHKWRKSIFPYLEAFFRQGVMVLDFITSDIDVPSQRITLTAIKAKLKPIPDLLDESFFLIITKAYAHHCFGGRMDYGVDAYLQERDYEKAFTSYRAELAEALKHWAENRLDQVGDDPEFPGAAKVLATLTKRVQFALTTDIFNTPNLGLELPTGTPLLCRAFIVDMASSLEKYEIPLMEVFRMLEPFYHAVILDSKKSTECKDQPTMLLHQWASWHEPEEETPAYVTNKILSIIFSHRTLALPKMNTVLLASRVSCPPLSALVYVSQAKEDIFVVDDDYDSGDAEGSDSEGRPLYFRQHHELVNYMKSWVRRDPAFTDEAVDLFHPDRDIGESGISKKLLQLEHGPILKNMLTTTGVRWASTNKSQLATQARTFANHSAAALWGHAHHGLAFLQHNEVWTLREQLDGYLQKALHQWRGFWDGVEEQPGGPYPEPAQTTISRPRKLELETTAMEMERKADESICKIYQMLLLPELGAIPANPQSKDADFLLAPQVYKRARSLVKAIVLASAKAQAVYATSDDTSDPCAYEFQLPAMLKVATEDDIEAYYTSLNMNTSKSKDIFPERSLKEQKRLFDREAREQRKKMSRKPRSQLLLGEPREEPKVYLYGEYPLHTMHQDSEPDGLQSKQDGQPSPKHSEIAQTDKNPTEDATSDREFPTGDKRKPESGPDSESLILKRARLHHNGEHTSIKHLIYHSHHIADLTPEGQPLPTTPPDAPAPTRIGLTQAPDDDDEDEALPPTFPERSPAQHNPSPSPHQRVERATSSPFDFGPDPDESTLNAISAIEDTLLSGAKRFSNPANLDPAVFDGQDNYRSPSRHSKRSNAKKVRKMADGRLFFAA